MVTSLLFGFFVLGPITCWLLGMFNPLGYSGVLPWKVPPCTCGYSQRGWCEPSCERTKRMMQ